MLNEKLKYPDLPFINLTDDDNVIICNFIKDIGSSIIERDNLDVVVINK